MIRKSIGLIGGENSTSIIKYTTYFCEVLQPLDGLDTSETQFRLLEEVFQLRSMS